MQYLISSKFILLCSIFSFSFLFSNAQEKHTNEDYVPDKATAIRVATALWLPVYGKEINDNKPFVAELKNGTVWVVRGTLHSQKGGVPYIEIQKKDCRVLKMYHDK